MENMVKHILDIDKQVQELHIDIDQQRLEADKEIAVEIEQIKQEYSRKFESDCEKILKSENEKFEQAGYERKKAAKKISEQMQEQFESNRKKWEKEIFSRVINGEIEN